MRRPGLLALPRDTRPATAIVTGRATEPFLGRPGLLTPEQEAGDPDRFRTHLLHVPDDGAYSLVAAVWRPGQRTPIHDHVAWCVVGVHRGEALHFLLPGSTGLAAVLAGGEPLFWRAAALLAGIAGVAESIGFLAAPGFPRALSGRFLRALDPLLYAGVGVAAVTSLPLGKLVPMQVEGVATGLVFLAGTAYLWLAYAERPAPLPTPNRVLNRI